MPHIYTSYTDIYTVEFSGYMYYGTETPGQNENRLPVGITSQ